MSEIEVVYDAPVVFTKDSNWASRRALLVPGAIIVLPDDAVLYVPRQVVSQEVTGQHVSDKEADDE